MAFSFKARCPSDLDCETPPAPCPPPNGNAPPIDYLAKDFLSFRQALLDFSALRYPQVAGALRGGFWRHVPRGAERHRRQLSYTQDRIAAESTLLTATQRRSVQQHARLVDYEPAPPVSAGALVQFEVTTGTTSIRHGLAVIAPAPDGTLVTFETGLGLNDASPPPPASPLWNREGTTAITGYWFDDSQKCLPAGATQMYVAGHGYGFQPGQMLLIETQPESSADPPLRQIVRLLPTNPAQQVHDNLLPNPATGVGPPTPVTLIAWQAADALEVPRDLSKTTVIGNIANATQGRTVTAQFVIGPPPPGIANPIPAAIERSGPQPLLSPGVCGSPPIIYLHTLANAPLAWLPLPASDPSGLPVPEINLSQIQPTGSGPGPWTWARRLLLAGAFDPKFTIDPVSYRTLATNSDGSVQSDYDGDAGDTIRFGDGVFGANPDPGMQFIVTYRYGAGTVGNVAAEAISQLDAATAATGNFTAVANPLAATGGANAQTLQSVQRLAPRRFTRRSFAPCSPPTMPPPPTSCRG